MQSSEKQGSLYSMT